MKKIFLMGRSEAGKTSLTQALKGEELHYHKTQYTNSNEDTIDSPGEYAESFQRWTCLFFLRGRCDRDRAGCERTL